jgi:hypothetical protein
MSYVTKAANRDLRNNRALDGLAKACEHGVHPGSEDWRTRHNKQPCVVVRRKTESAHGQAYHAAG